MVVVSASGLKVPGSVLVTGLEVAQGLTGRLKTLRLR